MGEPEIELRLAARMGQRNEDRFLAATQFFQCVTHGPIGVRIVMLVTQTFVDAFGCVTLLGGKLLVFFQIVLDEGNERSELRGAGTASFVFAGRFALGDFRDGPKVVTKAANSLAFGNFFDEEGVADGGPEFHVVEHRVGIVAFVGMIVIVENDFSKKNTLQTR